MTDYPYGYCGMPCALCSRYRTNGKSMCPGCSCDGYYTVVCRVHHCCKEKGLIQCGGCAEFPCARLAKMTDFKDLDTNHAKQRNCAAVKKGGFDSWYAEYAKRADMLTVALEKYNDGRMKRFLCELFIKEDIKLLYEIIQKAEKIEGTQKEKGKAFRKIVEDSR